MRDDRTRTSGGLTVEVGSRLTFYEFSLPSGDVVKVIGPNLAAGQHVQLPHYVGAGGLGVSRPLNSAYEGLVDADLIRNPLLSSGPIFPPPFCELHAVVPSSEHQRDGLYVFPSYFVNGHGKEMGSEYVSVAYVYVMHPGNRIRQLRKAARLTQAQLGMRVGMEQDVLSNYENGKRPLTIRHMKALARELGCSPADILADEDNPERLTPQERLLLEAFRHSSPAAQDVLLTSARAVAERDEELRATG